MHRDAHSSLASRGGQVTGRHFSRGLLVVIFGHRGFGQAAFMGRGHCVTGSGHAREVLTHLGHLSVLLVDQALLVDAEHHLVQRRGVVLALAAGKRIQQTCTVCVSLIVNDDVVKGYSPVVYA